jgi:pyruvate/2-oxoglutarate dehydrogenase complex dihydrolipoamide acyltransferase (E2) component
MSDAPKTAQTDNQAETETARGPYDDYVAAAGDVVRTIGTRDETHGDPEAFGATFARFLSAYLGPIVAAGRQLGPADSFAVLDLMKTARIAVGGHHPDHYRDKAGYGLLGLVHVQRAFAYVEAQQAQEDARQEAAARTPKAPEPADAPEPAPIAPEAVRAARKPAPTASVEFVAQPAELATPDLEDDDRDLLRWALDPGSNPFADLFDDADGRTVRRPGVTVEAIEARRLRVLELVRGFAPADAREQELRSRALAAYGTAYTESVAA